MAEEVVDVTFMVGVNFCFKVWLLALIVCLANVAIYDGFGSQTLNGLYLLGWWMVAFIILAGLMGLVIASFQPEPEESQKPKYKYR